MADNTIHTLDAVREKLNAYYNTALALYQQVSNSPEYLLEPTKEEISRLIEETIRFVRDNEILVTPANWRKGKRFKAREYNDIIDSIAIDLEVTFARMRSLLAVLNNTSAMINGRTSKLLNEIDEMVDKIANLSALKTTHSQFDNVVYDTFILDNNTLDDKDYKTMHHESGGIMTIRDTYSDIIIERRENFNVHVMPLNRDAVHRIYSENLTSSNMVDAFDASVYSYNYLSLKDYEIGKTAGDTIVAIDFNGATIGIILRLPSVKFVNNVAVKFVSSGLTEIVDIYYTKDSAGNIVDHPWTQVDFSVDMNNIRGASINFPTIEAGSILLVMGQKSVIKITTEAEKGISKLIRGNTFSLSELADHIEENGNVVSRDRIASYATPDVARKLSDDTTRIINSIIEELESMLPATENPAEAADAINNYTDIFEYNFSLYDLRVNYIHYYSNSTFKSEWRGGEGKIADVMLTATGNNPTDTVVNHYIEMTNGLHRILPNNETSAKDVITVVDPDILSYDVDLLMNTPVSMVQLVARVKVYVNNVEIDYYDEAEVIYNWTPNRAYPGADISTGITFDSTATLNFGDTIVIEYETASYDLRSQTYHPDRLNIEKTIGNPVITNQQLIYGKTHRMLLENQGSVSGMTDEYTSYGIPSEIITKLFPVSGETVEPDVAFEVQSGIVKDDPSNFPPYTSTTRGAYAIEEDWGRVPSKTIYYGRIDEAINASDQDELTTQYAYIPGTIHAAIGGLPLSVTEYNTDPNTTANHNAKNEFTLDHEVSGQVLSSYIPANLDTSIQDTNIASPNQNEIYQGTKDDASIELPFYPHLDRYIVRSALNPASYWIYSLGTFVNTVNENIVYSPIIVRIDGRLIMNATDYLTAKEPDPDLFRYIGNNYMYYVKGRKVIFNTTIQKPIRISYYVLQDQFRLVSKLYRMDRKVDDITPEMYGFALYLNERDK